MTVDPHRRGSGATYDIVIPTIGRPSLARLLDHLDLDVADLGEVVIVDDRRRRGAPLPLGLRPALVRVVAGQGRGPAAARNTGWRATTAPWVVFLDDDTVPEAGWSELLLVDLRAAGRLVAGVQGVIRVPLPAGRRPTDWERDVASLERARWVTADMALRRSALEQARGFDERFPRAYREDADLALRLLDAGWRLEQGRRRTEHPVPPARFWASVRRQAGNADDVLMDLLHGRDWRVRASAPRGERRRHLVTVAAAVTGAAAAVAGRRGVASVSGATCVASIIRLAARRIQPGPATRGEVATMVVTSAVLPFAAVGWWLRGWIEAPRRLTRPPVTSWGYPDAVLFDRDGTLIEDVPYNGDPSEVRLRPTVLRGVRQLRERGIAVGLVTNQSGVARGVIDRDAVDAVNDRVASAVGGLDHIEVCVHGPSDGCACRKPAPGMILAAASALGARPSRCVVIGDIGADMEAARAAGARGILVPTSTTLTAEIEAADEVASTVDDAVSLVLLGGAVVKRILVARLDNAGDVLLAGPLVRALRGPGRTVHLLCSPRGAAAGDLLPGVDRVEIFDAPWIAADPPRATEDLVLGLVRRLRTAGFDEAIISTSDHQSPLPLALALRMSGVARIGAISEDYPGSLLDVRHRVPDTLHEVERNLSLAKACGYVLDDGDRGELRIDLPGPIEVGVLPDSFVVVHPGASVPARTWGADGFRALVATLAASGESVVVTGGRREMALTARVAGEDGLDLGGRLDLAQLGVVLQRARAVVVGNTGPAHLAAAVATPVVSLFPPTVPVHRWRPWAVPNRVLGDQAIACRGCRSRQCPLPGHPCLGAVSVREVMDAIDAVTGAGAVVRPTEAAAVGR